MFYFRKSHLQFTTWSILPKLSCWWNLLIKVRVKVAVPKIHFFKFGTIKNKTKKTWKWSNNQTKTGKTRCMTTCMAEDNQRCQNNELGTPKHILLFMKSSKLASVTEFRVGISDMLDMDEHFLTKKNIDLLIISDQENYWFIAYLMKSNFEMTKFNHIEIRLNQSKCFHKNCLQTNLWVHKSILDSIVSNMNGSVFQNVGHVIGNRLWNKRQLLGSHQKHIGGISCQNLA